MSGEPIDESQITAFRAELDEQLFIDLELYEQHSRALAAVLLSADDNRSLSKHLLDFARDHDSIPYITAVFHEALRIWGLWILHEGNVALVPQYSRNLHAFVMTARIIGLEPLPPSDVEQGGFKNGHEAEKRDPV